MTSLTFRFYDPDKAVHARKRQLPHIEQPGVCYFVTWMTKDAFPRPAMEKWKREKRHWLTQRGYPDDADPALVLERMTDRDRRHFQRFASSRYHRVLDKGSGACVLRNSDCSEVVAGALEHHGNRTCLLADYVIMPNHVHVLLQPHEGQTLKKILSSIRTYSAREINKWLNQSGPFWAHEPFDHMVRSAHFFRRYQAYIRANPKRAGLREGEYVLRSL